ncbi:MAG TPA: hypothetical protein VKU41_14915 [Polyangiaceae bacterium]|nr:hypothetical protein [Polyangiaceae bacterium]
MTLHAPGACASGLPALGPTAYGLYYPLGDFDPRAAPGGHRVTQVGEDLPELDSSTRALLVDATDSDREWTGIAAVPSAGDFDLLLLPTLTSCSFPELVGSRGRGSQLATVASGRVLVVGGASGPTALPTLALHLDTGAVDGVTPDLLTPRTGATVTAFGAGALVAGGVDALSGGDPLASAEVYSSDEGGFDQQHPVLLSGPRTNHGAVVLASGQTLLVGGLGGSGRVLASMEIVDSSTRTVRAEGVASLAVPRQFPTVLRLASGEILVAGGVDASGNAVATLEWFSPDASRATKRPADLVTGAARAYTALSGGGALAVVAPASTAPVGFQNVWVIDAEGGLEPAMPLAGSVTAPVLFGAAGGAPVLWTGGADGRWLRWQPWAGAFAALGELDDVRANVGEATTSGDAGLGLWIDDTAQRLVGLRFDSRGEYSALAAGLLSNDTSDTAPDRLAPAGAFDPARGLTLASGMSAFVTDRTYTDVVVDVDAPTGEPPIVVLRDELGNEVDVGGATCPGALVGTNASIEVHRQGATVRWSTVPRGPSGTCPTALTISARVSIGVRGAPGGTGSVARNLRVARADGP